MTLHTNLTLCIKMENNLKYWHIISSSVFKETSSKSFFFLVESLENNQPLGGKCINKIK